jgi:hypothetical protein
VAGIIDGDFVSARRHEICDYLFSMWDELDQECFSSPADFIHEELRLPLIGRVK